MISCISIGLKIIRAKFCDNRVKYVEKCFSFDKDMVAIYFNSFQFLLKFTNALYSAFYYLCLKALYRDMCFDVSSLNLKHDPLPLPKGSQQIWCSLASRRLRSGITSQPNIGLLTQNFRLLCMLKTLCDFILCYFSLLHCLATSLLCADLGLKL